MLASARALRRFALGAAFTGAAFTGAAFAQSGAPSVQQNPTVLPSAVAVRPITAPTKHAGTFHLATGTWTRGTGTSNLLPPSSVLYDNTCDALYYASNVAAGQFVVDEGRLPSSSSPLGQQTSGYSVPGIANSYQVDGFKIYYCTSTAQPTDLVMRFYECYSGCTNPSALAPTAMIPLSGLPSTPATGLNLCWTMNIDLLGSGQEFVMNADCNGVYDNSTVLDNFAWSMTWLRSAAPGQDQGPIIAGSPTSCQFGDATVFSSPSSTFGTGLGQLDRFWDSGDNTPGFPPGCYYFGGSPWGGFYLELTGQGPPPPPTPPSVVGSAIPNPVMQGNPTVLRGTVTPGHPPISTGLAVTGNLASIGGLASVPFLDDGVLPDVTAGDMVFSVAATPSAALPNGTYTIPLTVTDAQGRTGTGSVLLNVSTCIPGNDVTPPFVTQGSIATCYPTQASAEAAAVAATSAVDNCTSPLPAPTVTTVGTCSAQITVTYTDAANNSSAVVYPTRIDGTAPTIACPASISIVSTGPTSVTVPAPTVSDGCSGTTVTNSFNGAADASGTYPLGTTNVTFTATDACGNAANCSMTVTITAPPLRISQVYGGGGEVLAPLANDYVEIYNADSVAQTMTNWSLQATTATGTTWTVVPLNGTVLPGRYFLVQLGAATSSLAPSLPPADASSTFNLSATGPKLALVSNTTALTGGTPTSASIVDFVGVGTTANWREPFVTGTLANNAPATSATLAIHRNDCGNQDTNANQADWANGAPSPRNSATPANNGVSAIGAAFPHLAEPTQTISLRCTPRVCNSGAPLLGATVTIDVSAIGGSAVQPMTDDGTGGDDLAGDGVYMTSVSIGAGTTAGSINFPFTVTSGAASGGGYIGIVVNPASTPDNDNCTTAQALAVPSVTSGSLSGATVESNAIATSLGAPTTGFQARRGVWYSVTGTGNGMTASMCGTAPSFDSVMFVLCGTCDGLSIVGNDDDSCGSLLMSQVTWCSTPGVTYYVWIAPFANGASTSAFTLTMTDDGTPCIGAMNCTTCTAYTPPGALLEQEAGYGTAVNDGCDSTPGRFHDIATPSYPPTVLRGTARGMVGNRDPDWYRFQATATDTFSATVHGQAAGFQITLYQLSAGGLCPATSLLNSSITSRCSATSINGVVTAGNWYALRVIPVTLSGAAGAAVFGGVIPGGNTDNYYAYLQVGGSPLNDACSAASPLALSTSYTAGAINTNTDRDGSSTCDATGRDVWYSLTTPAIAAGTFLLNVDTCGSATDTALALFDACGGNEIACNDACGVPCLDYSSCLSVPVLPGNTTLKLRVSDKGLGGGTFQVRAYVSYPNDDCLGAIPIACGLTSTGSTTGALIDTSAAPTCLGPGNQGQAITAPGVWYQLTSDFDQTIYADTLTASYDTRLSVYSGTCGNLSCLTANDDISSTLRSKVGWRAAAGQTYFILVHGFNAATGTFTLNVTCDPTPANDLCSSPAAIAGSAGSIGGTNVGATADNAAIATLSSCAPARTFWDTWYSYTAPCSSILTVSTCGSFDTVLSVHSSCPTSSVANMITGLCSSDGPVGCAPGSSLSFAVTQGTTYLIRVATAGTVSTAPGGGSPFTLVWTVGDTDGDGTLDCLDGCPYDPLKVASGICGCGAAETDHDNDGTPTCIDGCPFDPAKVAAGLCGCGVADADSDGDSVLDCLDGCPGDPLKTAPGTCGCGSPDVQTTFYLDTDGDGYGVASSSLQACSRPPGYAALGGDCDDANASAHPGAAEDCGNGIDDNCDLQIDEVTADVDGDGSPDCSDGCPLDPAKVAPGICGCGAADADSDNDATLDCNDGCPFDPSTVTDTTPPVVTSGSIASCYASRAAAEADAIAATSAVDHCTSPLAAPTVATVGTCSAQITVTYTDASNNSAAAVYFTRIDSANPTVTCPPDITVTATVPTFVQVPAPVVNDDCAGVTVINSFTGTSDASGIYPLGTTIVTFTVIDACSNSASSSMSVTLGVPVMRISQVYGGGGTSQAPLASDYVEIHNAGNVPQVMSNWSIQAATATGSAWSVVTLNGTVNAGRYYLVRLTTPTPVSLAPAIPAPDATSATLDLSPTAGKVALCNSNAALSGTAPTAASIVDFVGYGTTANWREPFVGGTVANNAPAPSGGLAIYRNDCGGQDTNANNADWALGFPSPRNSSTPAKNGLTGIGSALPYLLEELQTVSLRVSPRLCGTSMLNAGTVVTVNLATLGGGTAVPMHDDGAGGDDLAGDGIYVLSYAIPAGATLGTHVLPVSVSDGSGNTGGAYLPIYVNPTPTPDNDNCTSAQSIPGPFPATVNGTLQNATVESNAIASSSGAFLDGMSARRGVWYAVTGTGNTMTASLCNTSPSFDSVIMVMGGTCDGLSVVAIGDNSGPGCAGVQASAAWCSEAGATYFVWVAPFANGGVSNAFRLDVLDSGTACAAPFPTTVCVGTPGPWSEAEAAYGTATNDGCDSTPSRFTSIAAPTFPATVLHGTASSTAGGRDADWYRWQATSSGVFTGTVTGQATGFQISLVQLSAGGSCPATVQQTSTASARCGMAAITGSVTAGSWYALKVLPVGLQAVPFASVIGGTLPGGTTCQYTATLAVGGGPPGVVGSASPAAVNQGATTILRGTVTAGTGPASTGLSVTGNLISVGGLAAAAFSDDGLYPDATAGDGIYSLEFSPAISLPDGSYTIGLTVTDAEQRTGAGTIALQVGYCATDVVTPCADGEWIVNVTIGSINNTSACGTGYENYTTQSTAVFLGSTVPITVDTTGFVPLAAEVFCDWNHDGLLTGANEHTVLNNSGGYFSSGLIVVPSNAVQGPTRMRVQIDEDGQNTPCGTGTYGNTEDYTLVVQPSVPPPNDMCAAADPLAISTTYTVGYLNTVAANEGSSACDPTGRDVWYSVTTPALSSGQAALNIDTCGSAIDTALALFDACGGAQIACNDNCGGTPCGGSSSCLSVSGLAENTTYKVRVSDKGLGSGGTFRVRAYVVYANESCSGAIPVSCGSATFGSTVGASIDSSGTSGCTGPGGQYLAITAPGVWYRITSASAQTLYAEAITASYDCKLSVYSGACGGLSCVTANNDIDVSHLPKVAWRATAGQTYFILVHGNSAATGTFTLGVSCDPTPPNDACSSATVITGESGSIAGTNVGATGEASSLGSIVTCAPSFTFWDTWYAWTAPCSTNATFSTCGTTDTVLSVHTACPGFSIGTQVSGACNDDFGGLCAPGSRVSLNVVAGTTYRIRVATSGAASASPGGGAAYVLTWSVPDTDGDGFVDCSDGCPLDPLKVAPGICGCGFQDVDTDGDGVLNCFDGCPNDPLKVVAGQCGCGNPETDSDGDGVANCVDGCPADPQKSAPGQCGCGVLDTDTDGDGVANCVDGCPADPLKAAPGQCGCGVADTDSDSDGTANCNDGCPNDPGKIAPGVCGCGVADTDSDSDGTPNCFDGCPNDPNKVSAGICGCGVADTDSDGDGTANCNDGCPTDPLKTLPGVCGCGTADSLVDADGDGLYDCIDNCPNSSNVGQADGDGDGVGDVCDNCALLSNPGQQDCDSDGVGDTCAIAQGAVDCNMNGVPDSCDLALATSPDQNANSIPDECELNGGTPFCFGDGSGNGGPDCPCGNNSPPGANSGCVTSTGSGSRLTGSGFTTLSSDTLVISATNLPTTGWGVFFQGAGSGAVPFGDGIRCATGSTIRLGTTPVIGGVANYPPSGGPRLSTIGLVPPSGGARYYQCFFRNHFGPCGSNFNVTNGVSVVWHP